jgi:hypothetical protein
MLDRAVIFCREPDWLAGRACFEARYGCQALPAGAIVVGIVGEDGTAMLFKPYCSTVEQERNWESVVSEARRALAEA